jgi:hypothetical protein
MITESENSQNIKAIENLLINNSNLCLSVKSISKRTGIKTKKVTYICHHSKLLRQIEPLEIGSGKTFLNVFTAI